MPLNLSDETVSYSDNVELFPHEKEGNPLRPYGAFELTLLSYYQSGPAGTEKNKGDKEYDLVTARVDTSTNDYFKPGDVYGFFFQTGGNGVTIKSRPHKIRDLRSFIAAAHGKVEKDVPLSEWPELRQKLIDNVYDGTDKIRLKTKEGKAREDGTHFCDKIWSAAP